MHLTSSFEFSLILTALLLFLDMTVLPEGSACLIGTTLASCYIILEGKKHKQAVIPRVVELDSNHCHSLLVVAVGMVRASRAVAEPCQSANVSPVLLLDVSIVIFLAGRHAVNWILRAISSNRDEHCKFRAVVESVLSVETATLAGCFHGATDS
jgi:hypothetical protein